MSNTVMATAEGTVALFGHSAPHAQGKKLPQSLSNALVLTVEQSKGLEFDALWLDSARCSGAGFCMKFAECLADECTWVMYW